MRWSYTLPMEPYGKARPRCECRGKKPTTRPHPPYEAWMTEAVQRLRLAWRGPPAAGPLGLVAVLVMPRPARRPRRTKPRRAVPPELWATGERVRAPRTPDTDNAVGAVMDALTKAGAILDDAEVTDSIERKWWAAAGEEPHIEIEITTMPWTVG